MLLPTVYFHKISEAPFKSKTKGQYHNIGAPSKWQNLKTPCFPWNREAF